MQPQHGADIILPLLILTDNLFIIGITQESECDTVSTEGRLNDIGDIFLIGILIEIFHRNAGGLLVLGEVKIGAVSNPPKLTPAEGEQEFDISCCVGVVGKLFRVMVAQAQVLVLHAKRKQEIMAVILPIFEPFQIGTWLTEKFEFHLFKLTSPEYKITGSNFIAEGFADLSHTEGKFPAGRALDILEINKDTLRRFGTEEQLIFGILRHTLKGLKHQIKLPDICKIMPAAVWTCNLMLVNVIHHLLIAPASRVRIGMLFNQLICAVTGFAVLAVHQRVREAADVAGGDPSCRIHQNCRIQPNIIL